MNAMKYLILFILLLAPLPLAAQGSHGVLLYQSLNPDSVMPDRFILRFIRTLPQNANPGAFFCDGFVELSASADFPSRPVQSELGSILRCTTTYRSGDTTLINAPIRLPLTGQQQPPSELWYRVNLFRNSCGITNAVRVSIPTQSTTPTVPALLRPIRISSTAMTLLWNKSFGSVQKDTMRYIAQLSTDSTFQTLTREITITDTTARFENLQPNTTYFYRIRAINNTGIGRFSSNSSQTTLSSTAPCILDRRQSFYLSFFYSSIFRKKFL